MNISDQQIGDGNAVYITFEAGPTHDGFSSAKSLVKHASDAGADAVKFQIFNPDRLIRDKNMLYTYDVLSGESRTATKQISEPLYDILKRRCMSEQEWKSLKGYADKLGISFFATVSDNDDIELASQIGCHSIKIASADINHIPLLKSAAKTGLVVQIDTGNATLGEIEKAYDIICDVGNPNIIIHNCPSGYPARLESINLRMIPTLKQMFNVPIAYSDHTPGHEMDIAAIALGANMVEKTITHDRYTKSVEHIMSLEPSEMKHFVKTIRDVEIALGNTRRYMSEKEQRDRLNIRRSVILHRDIPKGKKIDFSDVTYQRPGYGISPEEFERLVGKTVRRNLKSGDILDFGDLK